MELQGCRQTGTVLPPTESDGRRLPRETSQAWLAAPGGGWGGQGLRAVRSAKTTTDDNGVTIPLDGRRREAAQALHRVWVAARCRISVSTLLLESEHLVAALSSSRSHVRPNGHRPSID